MQKLLVTSRVLLNLYVQKEETPVLFNTVIYNEDGEGMLAVFWILKSCYNCILTQKIQFLSVGHDIF